jgi:hypothetical protein
MRDEAIVLLAAVTSTMLLTVSVARATPADRGRGSLVNSPRMISWSVCGVPSSGSAFSAYASNAKADEPQQGSSIREDPPRGQCGDEEEAGAEGDLYRVHD